MGNANGAPKSRFVNLSARETVRLELDGGDWVEVKERLTNREQRRVNTAGFQGLRGVGEGDDKEMELSVDWEEMEFQRLATYIVDWSFRGADDRPIQYNADNLDRLDAASFDEIKKALDEHVGGREQEKNKLPGPRAKKIGSGSTTGTKS